MSKTTTCFNLGWMLAERGNRVVLVDADPQCNLTGMVLDLGAPTALDTFYNDEPKRNIRAALEPAFASRPRPLEPVECVEVEGRPGLYLVPGHVGLAEDEVSLGIAQQLSESVQALQNLPGSFHHLIQITAAAYDADYVIIDLSPGLGSVNQNLVMTSDFFIVPASPDVFSIMAIDSLARVLPRWARWAVAAADLEALSQADYPFPSSLPKFLGLIVQRYRLRSGEPTEAFARYFNELDNAVTKTLMPALREANLALTDAEYEAVGLEGAFRLASVPDFNTLIANSQQCRRPVFALTKDDVKRSGVVWDQIEKNINAFDATFRGLADRIEGLVQA